MLSRWHILDPLQDNCVNGSICGLAVIDCVLCRKKGASISKKKKKKKTRKGPTVCVVYIFGVHRRERLQESIRGVNVDRRHRVR